MKRRTLLTGGLGAMLGGSVARAGAPIQTVKAGGEH